MYNVIKFKVLSILLLEFCECVPMINIPLINTISKHRRVGPQLMKFMILLKQERMCQRIWVDGKYAITLLHKQRTSSGKGLCIINIMLEKAWK